MGSVSEYFIYDKNSFFADIQQYVPDAKQVDTDRLLLAFGLELADGRVMVLRSENYREGVSPAFQLDRAVETFYGLEEFFSGDYDCIWPWRDHELIMDDLKLGQSKNLIDRKYLEDD